MSTWTLNGQRVDSRFSARRCQSGDFGKCEHSPTDPHAIAVQDPYQRHNHTTTIACPTCGRLTVFYRDQRRVDAFRAQKKRTEGRAGLVVAAAAVAVVVSGLLLWWVS